MQISKPFLTIPITDFCYFHCSGRQTIQKN